MTPFRMAPLRCLLMIVIGFALATAGCKPKTETMTGETTPSPTVAPTESADVADSGAALDVKRVNIKEADGTIEDPRTVKVRKREQIVVWALQGAGELQITFADSPFGDPPQQPTCLGRFCVILYPARENADEPRTLDHEGRVYKYKIVVDRDGKPVELDPDVEVIP